MTVSKKSQELAKLEVEWTTQARSLSMEFGTGLWLWRIPIEEPMGK